MSAVRLHELAEDHETLLALEPEELALLVLQSLVERERQDNGQFNRHNFSQEFRHRNKDVQRAIMEAWAWLQFSGCVAELPLHTDGWVFITRRGHELAKATDRAVFAREQSLPRHLLHPIVEQKAWAPYLRGEYDTAVFQAFKQLEVAIRGGGGFADTDLGVDLARKAFNVGGPLADPAAPKGEQEGLSHLVAGGLGSYKNPHSHRNVAIGADEAAEMIVLASHLLKIVDARKSK